MQAKCDRVGYNMEEAWISLWEMGSVRLPNRSFQGAEMAEKLKQKAEESTKEPALN